MRYCRQCNIMLLDNTKSNKLLVNDTDSYFYGKSVVTTSCFCSQKCKKLYHSRVLRSITLYEQKKLFGDNNEL